MLFTSRFQSRLFEGVILCSLFLNCAVNANESAPGTSVGLYSLIYRHPVEAHLKWGVLGTDFWRPSDSKDKFHLFTEFPVHRPLLHRTPVFLLQGDHFTPEVYLEQIQELSLRPGGCDVLFYYGGRRKPGMEPHGLNFNAWSSENLHRLRALGGRPFIGLETFDEQLIDEMLVQLEGGGYGRGDTLFVRIGAEPSTMAYGTLDGTPHGQRHTVATYEAYHERFRASVAHLRAAGLKRHLHFRIVFAGDSKEDFEHYAPNADDFDAIGYDLYVTPANMRKVMPLLHEVSKRFGDKPLVIPELGIATGGIARRPIEWAVRASPEWGETVLGEVLVSLGKHSAGVAQMTVFSVNVGARMESRNWNWAWTPRMFDILAEWRESPRTWKKKGFHRYDPSSYPLGADILLDRRPGMKIYYRRLSNSRSTGRPIFLETVYILDGDSWKRLERAVTFNDGEVSEVIIP